MSSYTYPAPKDTYWHKSGAIDADGLSEEWLTHEKALGFRPMASLQGAIEEQRKVMDEGAALRDAHFSDLDSLQTEVEVAHHELGVTDGKIAIRRYWRKDSSAPAPAAVFYHGGGWIMGSLPADDIFCRMIARDLGHVVLSVDYRLAPEHPYPTPVNDCYEAYVWTVKNAREFNIDDKKIYVTGNSAGGHLSAAVALKVIESEYSSSLAAQILRIPFACDPQHYDGELPERTTVPIINDAALKVMLDQFVPSTSDRTLPYVSPYLAKRELLAKLPPTYIDVDAADPMCVPAVAYGKVLEDAGVPVKVFGLEGMPHGSYVLFPGLPSSRAAWDACVEGTKWALDGGK